MAKNKKVSDKLFLNVWIISLFFGLLGIDRFYLGKIDTGILKLITVGGFGIWYIVDVAMLLLNKTQDSSGRQLKDYEKHKWFAIGFTILFVIALIATTSIYIDDGQLIISNTLFE